MTAAQLLAQAKSVAREPYAWPGGYPKFLVMADSGALCSACIKKEWSSIVRYTLWRQSTSGWMPAGAAINYEDNALFCDHCSQQIPSAYEEEEEE